MTENQLQSPLPIEGDPLSDTVEGADEFTDRVPANRLEILWEQISYAGLLEPITRIGTHVLLIAVVLVVVGLLRTLYLDNLGAAESSGRRSAFAAPIPTPTPTMEVPVLPAYSGIEVDKISSVQRNIEP